MIHIQIFAEISKECQEKAREQPIKEKIKWRNKDVTYIVGVFKEMPGLTDQARSVVLKFWEHYNKGWNIVDDIKLKKPATLWLLENDVYKALRKKMGSYTRIGNNRGLDEMIGCEINQKVCDIAKTGKDWYEFIKNYAIKIGMPVSAEDSTTDAPTVQASCSEDSTTESSATEGK